MFVLSQTRCLVLVLLGLMFVISLLSSASSKTSVTNKRTKEADHPNSTQTIARPRAERTPTSLRLQPKPDPAAYNPPSLATNPSKGPTTHQSHQPQAQKVLKSTFKIQILLPPSTPSKPSHQSLLLTAQPLYLSPNGSTTSQKSLAALCHLSPSTRLYCGNFVTPISAPVNAPAALFSSVRGSARGGLESGTVSLGFEVSEKDRKVVWRVGGEGGYGDGGEKEMGREVRWVVRIDGQGKEAAMSVWAVFRNDSVGRESVGVEMVADYEV